MRVGSLFSGIGGFDLGLERAGMRTAWFCEQDEFCQHVLAKHWPGVPCYPDIAALRGADVEPVDVLCGGFPCQDLSLAGAGHGLDGARSGLWSEYARLIGELGPRYVVVENVSALLARGLGRVLGDLAALGYDAEWDCIPASAVGANHRRDRVWLVAYPASERGGSGGSRRRDPAERDEAGAHADHGGDARPDDVADADSQRCGEGLLVAAGTGQRSGPRDAERSGSHVHEGWAVDDSLRGRHGTPDWEVRPGRDGPLGTGWWSREPDVDRMAHGISNGVDRRRALGNALVPQIAEWIGRRILDHEAQEGGIAA